MEEHLTLFISTFTTLLAVINPLEAMPIFMKLLHGQDQQTHRQVAFKSCLYATILMFFFLILGTLVMRLFGVPLSMVRIGGASFSCASGLSFLPLPLPAPSSPARRVGQIRVMSPLIPWLCLSWWARSHRHHSEDGFPGEKDPLFNPRRHPGSHCGSYDHNVPVTGPCWKTDALVWR
jgi:hypothetical protein